LRLDDQWDSSPTRAHFGRSPAHTSTGPGTGTFSSARLSLAAEFGLVPLSLGGEELGGISRTTFYKLVEERSLSMVKIGRRTFVATSELDAFVKRQRS
jgi:excisionase family DNA binding protein